VLSVVVFSLGPVVFTIVPEVVWQPVMEALEAVDTEEEVDDTEELTRDLRARSLEFIKDRISQLIWQEMQELVAGLLRAMRIKGDRPQFSTIPGD